MRENSNLRKNRTGTSGRSTGRTQASKRNGSSGSRGRSRTAANRRSYESADRTRSSGKTFSNGRRKKQNHGKMKAVVIVLLIVVVIAVILGLIIHSSKKKTIDKMIGENEIAKNVFIDGVDVGGLTKEAAQEAVQAHIDELGRISFTFTTNGNAAEIQLRDLGLKPAEGTVEDLVEQAYQYGQEGNTNTLWRKAKGLMNKPYNIEVSYVVDHKIATNTINQRCKVMEGAAQDAYFIHNGDQFEIVDEVPGIVVHVEDTVAALEGVIDKTWDKTPKMIEVIAEYSNPRITRALLETVPNLLSSYSTDLTYSNEGRFNNVHNSTLKLRGLYLNPGEEASVNAIIEPYTEENGYMPAGSFEDGEIVQSMGGGICQTSSTLYNALLFAEVEVTERMAHSMQVTYVATGRDAAIAGDYKDLKFRNNLEHPIFIDSECTETSCTFYIFGTEYRDPGRSLKFEAEVTNEVEYKTEYIEDPDFPTGYEEIKTHGINGCNAELYKYIYQDNELIDKIHLSSSSYQPHSEVVIRGPKADDEESDHGSQEEHYESDDSSQEEYYEEE